MAHSTLADGKPYNQVQKTTLLIVWFTIAVSGIVLFEPAPIDGLMIGLVLLLPMTGLCIFTTTTAGLFLLLMTMCVGGYLAAAFSIRLTDSAIHNSITLYLCLSAVVIAAFIRANPEKHFRLIFSAYTFAAYLAASAAVIGYFNIIPPLTDLFTEYDRASGTFKDPNVFGPFLIPVILYLFHRWMNRDLVSGILPAAIVVFLCFTILISFSRGAWMHLAFSLMLFGYFSFVSAPTNLQRLKLLYLGFFGLLAVTFVIVAALQTKSVGELLKHRASLTQEYDVGPNGRFGGQHKAIGVILENPIGIGTHVFGEKYHHEQAHNNYLTMFMRTGWLGGFAYLILTITTLVVGLRHAFIPSKTLPLFQIVYASFFGLCLENLLVDTEHWRHFFLLLGLIWGFLSVKSVRAPAANSNLPALPTRTRKAEIIPTFA